MFGKLRLAALPALLAVPALLTACGNGGPAGGPATARAMDGAVVQAYGDFAFDLLRNLSAETPDENVFISPTSVAVALSMVYNGAKGETQEGIAQALRAAGISMDVLNESNAAWLAWLDSDDPAVELDLANSIWAREGVPVLEDFLDRNRRYYGSEVEFLDFSRPDAADIINAWVSEQTRERIEEIVASPIDPGVIMYLINALYFRGDWTKAFHPDSTHEQPFTLADGSVRDVPLMHRRGDMLHYDGDGFSAVSLPYGEGRFTMDVLLPDDGRTVAELVGRLDTRAWNGMVEGFEEKDVRLWLPKFTLEYEAELNDVLKAMGMEDAFSPMSADFTGMVPREWLGEGNVYISKVKHKTFLDVNEEGSEAAAVTSVEIVLTSLPADEEQPIVFRVDRPFVMAIRDTQTGTILFLGAITDPGA